MKLPAKLNTSFDKYLVGGLGCGFIVLCVLISSFYIIWQNPPTQRPVTTQMSPIAGDPITNTPGPSPTPLIQPGTPPTSFPTVTPAQPGQATMPPIAPPPSGADFGDEPPTGKIVFTCFVNQIDQICLMNADGTGRKQLTNFEATAFYASLSPDGDTIYFSSRQSGSYELYSINIKGKGLRRLTKNIGSVYAPERSSIDERIIFANETGGQQRIWIMRSDGNNPHPISDGPDDIDPTWSPDGRSIAFASARTGQRQLYVMDRDGSEVRQITDLPNMGGRSSWSPDGTKLTFYAGPTGDHNIFVINADGTGLVQLTNGGDNLGPSWSPDGNWIAFTSFRDGNNEIYIMHPDGSAVTRLTSSPASDWQPRWGP